MKDDYHPTVKATLKRRGSILAPVLITTVGIGWLLTTRGVIPGVQWVWVLVLAVLGAFILFLGIDKVSIAVGPSLMTAALLSILRQTGWIAIDTEIPVLTIAVGALWTAAYLLPIRVAERVRLDRTVSRPIGSCQQITASFPIPRS